tara:strand:+ start:150 stop:998 length:849 start_codon:yes stop_codon:yes gene_type:complete
MTDQRRQELFRDAEPAADGGTFRVVAAMCGFAILVAVGWIAISLNEVREDLRTLQKDESRRLVVLSADVESLRRETQEKLGSVNNALSEIWHQHKPAELEVMGFLASLDPAERESMRVALESLESRKDSSGSSLVADDRGIAEAPVLISPTKPVLVSPSRPPVEVREPETSESENENLSPEAEPSDGQKRGVPAEKAGALESREQGPSGSPGTPDSLGPERDAIEEFDEGSAAIRNYVIQPGDSLSRIALKHRISSRALAEANGITDPNKIRVGQVLKIPEE